MSRYKSADRTNSPSKFKFSIGHLEEYLGWSGKKKIVVHKNIASKDGRQLVSIKKYLIYLKLISNNFHRSSVMDPMQIQIHLQIRTWNPVQGKKIDLIPNIAARIF